MDWVEHGFSEGSILGNIGINVFVSAYLEFFATFEVGTPASEGGLGVGVDLRLFYGCSCHNF